MTTLDELLNPNPTSKEDANENYPHSAEGDACVRIALVRQTLLEAAKLVCPLCDIGYPLVLGLNDGETGSQYEHENRGYNQGKCLADKIHARLAKEKL